MPKCLIEVDNRAAIEIELFNTSAATKFLDQLRWHMDNSSVSNKEAFYWYADEASVRQDLTDAIHTINKFLRHQFIVIDDDPDWEDRNLYNQLHESFEALNGSWGENKIIMAVATPEVKSAIRQLNASIHRLENRPYIESGPFYLSWDKNTYRRQDLDEEDYEQFQDTLEPGLVYLSYVEVGKHLKELFDDGLDPKYEAYKNLHQIGAECDIFFGVTEAQKLFSNDFLGYCRRHGIDPADKKLGIGKLPIGKFSGTDDFFTKDSKVTNIRLEV